METMTVAAFAAAWKAGELRGDINVFFDGETIRDAGADALERHSRWMSGDESAMATDEALQFTSTGYLAHAWSLGMEDGTLAGVYTKQRWS